MLAHGRRDRYAFCDHESDGVDGDGDGAWTEARDRLLQGRRGIVFAADARHGGREVEVDSGT